MIIAFVGRAGSGKDYQCKLLEKQGYTRFAFAEQIRKIIAEILGIDYSCFLFNYDELKKTIIYNGLTLRNLMENLGSSIRKIEPLFWCTLVLREILKKPKDNYCISDMRYANEYFAIYEFCKTNNIEFKCIFCDYRSDRYQEFNNHESAKLSNYLVEQGFKDLQEITVVDMIKFNKK